MGVRVGRSGKRGFRDINVTPLVDVMLVLLVVFMVTAPLLTTGLKIDLPNVQAASTPVADGRLIVTVTAEGLVMFEDKDITKGVFQMYILRWIGSNEDPDIFRYAYATQSFPPKGGNRGRYSNARVDALLQAASAETNQDIRRKEYIEVQQILADELPGIPLFYPNNEVVHSSRLSGLKLNSGGSFEFLRDAVIQ